MQFQFYLVEDQYGNLKQEAYFESVVGVVRSAASRAGLREGTDWEGLFWDLATFKAAYPKVTLKTTPSVCLRIVEDNQATFFVGIRDTKVLESAFYDIFITRMQPSGSGDTGGNGNNTGGDGNGTSQGAGGEGWFPFGSGRSCNIIDKLLEGFGITKQIKQIVYGAGATLLGYNTLNAQSKIGQGVQGAGAAFLLYLCLTDTESACVKPKKKE